MSCSPEFQRAGAILSIDLDALVANWRLFSDMAGKSGAEASCVVKADAYGLGVSQVAPALQNAGCKTFFVASIDEGIELREILGPAPTIHVFYGLMDGAERDFSAHNLVPVLNTLGEVGAWRSFCSGLGQNLACDLHIDTGMSRLGLDGPETTRLVENPDLLTGLNLNIVMSHLASGEDKDNPSNARQLNAFKAILPHVSPAKASLANSSGVFLGSDYHFDMIRPGIALFGSNPTPYQPNPMNDVIRLQGKVLQVRTIDAPQGVGYGATHQASAGTKIATLAAGYADGLLRSLSNTGHVFIGEHKVPIIGRVSMDLITIDVTHISDDLAHAGTLVDLIGPKNPVDDIADKADTIGYEVLTQLGKRYHRVYTGGLKSL